MKQRHQQLLMAPSQLGPQASATQYNVDQKVFYHQQSFQQQNNGITEIASKKAQKQRRAQNFNMSQNGTLSSKNLASQSINSQTVLGQGVQGQSVISHQVQLQQQMKQQFMVPVSHQNSANNVFQLQQQSNRKQRGQSYKGITGITGVPKQLTQTNHAQIQQLTQVMQQCPAVDPHYYLMDNNGLLTQIAESKLH